MTLYSLREHAGGPAMIRYAPDVTHEFCAFILDEAVEIKFEQNLWTQPKLHPLLPAFVSFQFRADNDAAAISRIQTFMDACFNGTRMPNIREHWREEFPDAIDLSRPILAYADASMRLRAVDESAAETEPEQPNVKPKALVASMKGRANLVAASLAIGVAIGLASASGYWTGRMADGPFTENWMTRTLVTSNGEKHPVIIHNEDGGKFEIDTLDNAPLTIFPRGFHRSFVPPP